MSLYVCDGARLECHWCCQSQSPSLRSVLTDSLALQNSIGTPVLVVQVTGVAQAGHDQWGGRGHRQGPSSL